MLRQSHSAVALKDSFFSKIIESNHIHLNQIYFARVRPLSAKHIFILSPAKLSIFDKQHACCQYCGAEFNPIYDFIYCQNLNHHCFNPLSFMKVLFFLLLSVFHCLLYCRFLQSLLMLIYAAWLAQKPAGWGPAP